MNTKFISYKKNNEKFKYKSYQGIPLMNHVLEGSPSAS